MARVAVATGTVHWLTLSSRGNIHSWAPLSKTQQKLPPTQNRTISARNKSFASELYTVIRFAQPFRYPQTSQFEFSRQKGLLPYYVIWGKLLLGYIRDDLIPRSGYLTSIGGFYLDRRDHQELINTRTHD